MLDVQEDLESRIIDKLRFLYGNEANAVFNEIKRLIIDFTENFHQQNPIGVRSRCYFVDIGQRSYS